MNGGDEGANIGDESRDSIPPIQKSGVRILPNTSGVRDAKEAVFVARMAREALKLIVEIRNSPGSQIPDARPC